MSNLHKFLFLGVVVLLAVALSFYVSISRTKKKELNASVESAGTSAAISSKADWDQGTLTYIDSTSSSGSMKIDNESVTVDVSSITPTGSVTGDVNATMDSNNATGVTVPAGTGNIVTYTFDMPYYVTNANFYSGDQDINAQMNVCATPITGTCLTCGSVGLADCCCVSCMQGSWVPNDWKNYSFGTFNKYETFKLTGGSYDVALMEAVFIGIPIEAHHISAPTQITNTNLYQWQSFTPTYTAPANTTVSFRFRTSTDASSWTSWTAYQTPNSGSSLDITSLVTSKTGDAGSETFYKYIQVETKLTSANGTSNPTVDDYSIGYHTNVVPNKPVGATVTMGS